MYRPIYAAVNRRPRAHHGGFDPTTIKSRVLASNREYHVNKKQTNT
jgi:hypothetical protein